MFRATQQRQDKAQSAENGAPLSRTAIGAALPTGGPGSGRPRRCAAWQGRAIPCAARLALNRFPTR